MLLNPIRSSCILSTYSRDFLLGILNIVHFINQLEPTSHTFHSIVIIMMVPGWDRLKSFDQTKMDDIVPFLILDSLIILVEVSGIDAAGSL